MILDLEEGPLCNTLPSNNQPTKSKISENPGTERVKYANIIFKGWTTKCIVTLKLNRFNFFYFSNPRRSNEVETAAHYPWLSTYGACWNFLAARLTFSRNFFV